jgi:beta-lactamase superfamily II metal-dependent hydrolase
MAKKRLTAAEALENVRESAQGKNINQILTQVDHSSNAGNTDTMLYRDLTEAEEKELKELGYRVTVTQQGSLKATKIEWGAPTV